MNDRVVGLTSIADYLLFNLNRYHHFEYVKYFGLKEPVDDVRVLLASLAIKHGYITKVRNYDHSQATFIKEVPCFERASEYFLRKFREGKLGAVNLDQDLFDSTNI